MHVSQAVKYSLYYKNYLSLSEGLILQFLSINVRSQRTLVHVLKKYFHLSFFKIAPIKINNERTIIGKSNIALYVIEQLRPVLLVVNVNSFHGQFFGRVVFETNQMDFGGASHANTLFYDNLILHCEREQLLVHGYPFCTYYYIIFEKLEMIF